MSLIIDISNSHLLHFNKEFFQIIYFPCSYINLGSYKSFLYMLILIFAITIGGCWKLLFQLKNFSLPNQPSECLSGDGWELQVAIKEDGNRDLPWQLKK